MSETENNEKRSNGGGLVRYYGSLLGLTMLVVDLRHISLETLEIAGFDGIYGYVELLEFWRRLALKLLLIARVVGSSGVRFWFSWIGGLGFPVNSLIIFIVEYTMNICFKLYMCICVCFCVCIYIPTYYLYLLNLDLVQFFYIYKYDRISIYDFNFISVN